MKLYKHTDLKSYVNANVCKSKIEVRDKPKNCWILEETADIISRYVLVHVPNAKFGICHGVRNGKEVEFFRQKLHIEVIGTEISEWVAKQLSNVIAWDFHEIKEEWVDNVDFIYSNSLDHSYDPEYCLRQWVKCLSPDGLCFVEWTLAHDGPCSSAECFAASKEEYQTMISKNHKLVDVLEISNPELPLVRQDTTIFVMSKKIWE
jgi:hypothetical protein